MVRLMKIIEVKENKKRYLDLLLLADEQEDMIDRYLDKGKMYVLDDNGVKCECVITDEGNNILEIKNIATVPEYQGKGYARALLSLLLIITGENTQFCKWEQEIVRFQSRFMKSVVLFVHTSYPIFLQIITTTQSMRVEYSW